MPDSTERTQVRVGDRTLTLTSLDKVLYPGDGTTKAEALQYVATVASALLPQLRDRPVTRVRWPHGTGDVSFFEKNVPGGTPSWVPRVTIETPGSQRGHDEVTYPLVGDVPTLMWLTNLAALELHVPQWRVDADGPQAPDRLVIDLDPGAPAGLTECAKVAVFVRDALTDLGARVCVPVTSGSKGMQLYARASDLVDGASDVDATRSLAEGLANRLAAEHPSLVVAKMLKSLRRGKVLLDWSQNTRAKTTICPYSLRGKNATCTVAAPRTWHEVEAAAQGVRTLAQLGPTEVLDRLDRDGDLMSALTE